jgi:hypothetical protein
LLDLLVARRARAILTFPAVGLLTPPRLAQAGPEHRSVACGDVGLSLDGEWMLDENTRKTPAGDVTRKTYWKKYKGLDR